MFLIRHAIRSKGSLNGVTVRYFGCAAGMSFISVVVYPVERAHYRLVYGTTQTARTFLPRVTSFKERNRALIPQSFMTGQQTFWKRENISVKTALNYCLYSIGTVFKCIIES